MKIYVLWDDRNCGDSEIILVTADLELIKAKVNEVFDSDDDNQLLFIEVWQDNEKVSNVEFDVYCDIKNHKYIIKNFKEI